MRPLIVYACLLVVTVVAIAWVGDRAQEETQRVAVESSQALRESQLAGCGRSKDDRMDSIRGWTAARIARERTAKNPEVPTKERLQAAAAASVYREVIAGFRRRLVDCSEAFPPVRVP